MHLIKLLLVLLASVPQLGFSEYLCEHAKLRASLTGLANISAHYLREKKFDLDQMIKEQSIEPQEFSLREILGNYIYVMPFKNDSILQIYDQKIEQIKTGPLEMGVSDSNLSSLVSFQILNFKYRSCIRVVEPDGNIYYSNCNIRFNLKENSPPSNRVAFELKWLEHDQDFLPVQVAKSTVRISLDPTHFKVSAQDPKKSFQWVDKLLEYFLNSDSAHDRLSRNLYLLEEYFQSYVDAQIRNLPRIARELVSVPKIDLKSISLSSYLPMKTLDLLIYLESYKAWLAGQKRFVREERFKYISLSQKREEVLDFFNDHLSLKLAYDFSNLKKVMGLFSELKNLFETKKRSSFTGAELNAIDQFLEFPIEDLPAFNLGEVATAEVKLNLVDYKLSKQDGILSFGVQLDDYPCGDRGNRELAKVESDGPMATASPHSHDFSLFVWTDTINEMLAKSFDEKLLDIKVDGKTSCKQSRTIKTWDGCRYSQSNVRFLKKPYLEFSNGIHKLKVPKLDVPGPLNAKFNTSIKTKACKNNDRLCVDFFDLKADGKLIPILRFFNLFLLDIIDVDGRLEKELNNRLASLGEDGIELIPNAVVTDSEDGISDYFEIKYKVQLPKKKSSFMDAVYQ